MLKIKEGTLEKDTRLEVSAGNNRKEQHEYNVTTAQNQASIKLRVNHITVDLHLNIKDIDKIINSLKLAKKVLRSD